MRVASPPPSCRRMFQNDLVQPQNQWQEFKNGGQAAFSEEGSFAQP